MLSISLLFVHNLCLEWCNILIPLLFLDFLLLDVQLPRILLQLHSFQICKFIQRTNIIRLDNLFEQHINQLSILVDNQRQSTNKVVEIGQRLDIFELISEIVEL